MSLIFAMKAGDNVATSFPGDASGLAAAFTYCGSNGHVLLPPGLSALSITPPAGVTVCRVDAGVDQRFGHTAFRGGPWYDVRAFGARGNGSTDDTTAIQSAIVAAEGAGPGASVFFGPGTYRTNGGLVCRRETCLIGLGTPVLQLSSTSATLVTFRSPTVGSGGMGGGIRGMSLRGTGGSSTSIGVRVGDPSDPDAYASRVSVTDCDISGFGYGVVLDGYGPLLTGENSASDGFAMDHCLVYLNVVMGLFIKNTFPIEISQITHTYFMSNGTTQDLGCAIGLSASGGGWPQASAAANLSMFGCTMNNNGNGVSGQIHVPPSAWMDLKMDSCSFEGGRTGHTSLAILSDGSSAYNGPRSEVRLCNCIFQMLPAPTTRRESILFGCGQLQVVNSRFNFEAGERPLAAIRAGVAGQFGSISLIGNSFVAGGTSANARVLDLTPASHHTSYFALGNNFQNMAAAPSLVVNPGMCRGCGDLIPHPGDYYTARKVAFHGLHLRSTSDPMLDVEFDVSGVGTYNQKFEVWNYGGRAFFRIPVIPSGGLPAPGPNQDGKMFLEDKGLGDRNLIVYAGGQRFRIDGGAAF